MGEEKAELYAEFFKQHSDPVVALDMAQAAARKIADEFDSL